jgi:hypothetical protein
MSHTALIGKGQTAESDTDLPNTTTRNTTQKWPTSPHMQFQHHIATRTPPTGCKAQTNSQLMIEIET